MRMTARKTFIRRVASAASVLSLAVGLAACSSSSSTGSGSADSTVSADPGAIKIMVIASMSNPAFDFPETAAAVQARIDALNADGGINGRKVTVLTCDDKNDPNTAAACARQAVSDGVVATVGDYSVQGDSIWPILDPAGIPRIGLRSITDRDATDPLSFPIDGNVNTEYTALAKLMIKEHHCSGMGLASQQDSAAVEQVGASVESAVKSAGVKWAGANFGTSTGAVADLSPVATKLVDAGATCVIMIVAPTSQVQFGQAFLQASPKILLGAAGTSIPVNWPTVVPSPLQWTMMDSFAPLTSNLPGVKQFLSEMKKYSPSATLSANAVRSWVAADVFAKVAATISGTITPKSLVAALNKASNIDTGGITAPISFTNPYISPHITREFNTKYIQQLDDNGSVVASGTFFDVRNA
jgi:ABC-type branched-subunit amino acid transport system substrate-binding protein